MTLYKSTLSEYQLKEKIQYLRDSITYLFPNRIAGIKMEENTIHIFGHLSIAKANIIQLGEELYVDLDVKHRKLLIVFLILTIVFISMFLFAENITINGEYPTIFDRIIFVGIAYAFIGFFVGIIHYEKASFKQRIISKLRLDK